MIYIKFRNQFDFEYDIQALIRSFYPEEALKSILPEETLEACDESVRFIVSFSYLADKIEIAVTGKKGERLEEGQTDVPASDRTDTKNRLKRLLYDILSRMTGKTLPWGTLSGIRPTKITSELLDKGMDFARAKAYLKETYYLSDHKADLSLEISAREREILKKIDYERGYSLYIGIPFCPTTCLYCSFPSYPISMYREKVREYLAALKKELAYVAREFSDRELNSVYIGGGTPTTLEPDMLKYLLDTVCNSFSSSHRLEFTVEAGRPDSITREKLKVLKEQGVSRISVNPQTMKEETLRIIGRRHTVEEVKQAFYMARELGFTNINMDFIAGLPGEGIEDIRETMGQTRQLRPDSITIHSLAIKRAAGFRMFKEKYGKYTCTNSEDIMQLIYDSAKSMGMQPYYLYRQKNMAGNLENVGYAVKGKEGIYNILIMEEKQPIIAVGAGASTKLVYPGEKVIRRVENVKNVDIYIERIDEMIERKKKAVEEWRQF